MFTLEYKRDNIGEVQEQQNKYKGESEILKNKLKIELTTNVL